MINDDGRAAVDTVWATHRRLLGGPDAQTKRVMALGTAQRNIAAALVVASQSFSDPKVVVMVIVVAIVGLIVLMPISRALASPIKPMRHGS